MKTKTKIFLALWNFVLTPIVYAFTLGIIYLAIHDNPEEEVKE